MFKLFFTVDKHRRFKSFISQTASIRLENSSSNAEKSFVSHFSCWLFLQTGLRCFQLCDGLWIVCKPA